MSYVITLLGYEPTQRFDGFPWTQARIAFSADNTVYTIIDTIALVPVDTDPTHPQIRNLTTTNSPAATGWFQVTFLDAGGNQEPTSPIQFPAGVGGGAASPTVLSARYSVRHRIRDGMPLLDANPVAFNTVRLESLTDQIVAIPTPVQTVFQCRFEDVPTQRYMNAQVVPGTLIAYLDGSWVGVRPTVDVDANGNFTLPVPPINQLLITYAWQYLADGEIDQFVDEARQWLREFRTVDDIPDGLVPALVSNAASRAYNALASTASAITTVRAGDSEVDWSKLVQAYQANGTEQCKRADAERLAFYTQGPEALDPTAVDVSHIRSSPYTPMR